MSAQDDPIHSVADFVKRVTIGNHEYCSKIVKRILDITGHVPVAYNVARGAGFCSYFARMAEAIGVKESIPLRISGKGRDIHKILGIASIYVFKDGCLPPPEHYINDGIKHAINTLNVNNYNNDHEVVVKAKLLLKNLIDNLHTFLDLLKSNWSPFVPIVEQQFIDYRVHIRGVPDLILENKEQRKAIVVEWKTSNESLSRWEEAQVLAYALLAGRRLGYSPEEAVDAILGRYDESTNEFKDIHILPVIIRPTTKRTAKIKPHPALSGLTGVDLSNALKKFKKILYNVKLEAEHLTVLTFNTMRLSADESKFIREKCLAEIKDGHKVHSLRLTPYQLPRGRPREQKKFPCTKCFNSIKMACKYYFGSGFNVRDKFDSTMWGLRFKIYDKLESLLLQYRAIYEIFAEKGNLVFEIIDEGKGIEYEIHGNSSFINEKVGHCYIQIRDGKKLIGKFKIDSVERILNIDTNNYTIRLRRKLRNYEKDYIPSTLREDKPCMLVLFENNIPLLSINLFCRVDSVEINNDYVDYIMGIPSSVFAYQFFLFKEYFEIGLFRNVPILLLGVDANLLLLELRAVDILQRTFDEKGDTIDLIHKDIIKEQVKDIKSTYDSLYYETDATLVPQLREIIRVGYTSKNKSEAVRNDIYTR
mgnify:CR=1 FL=1|jgi:hypothetical protein